LGTKFTKRRRRQSYCDKSSVSHLAFSSRLLVASQSNFSPVSHISLRDWLWGLHRATCRWHQSVLPTASMLLIEVNYEDGGWTHVLSGVRCRVWAQKSFRNN